MKKILCLVVCLTSLAVFPAFSQSVNQPRLITVSGAAEVKVVPDEVYLSLGVETRQPSLDAARTENDAQMTRVLAFLKGCQIDKKDMQTDFLNIGPTYNEHDSVAKPVGYVVRKSIEVRLTDLAGFEKVLTGVLTNGVNTVHGVQFRTSQLRQHRDKARAMAIRAAKEKAEALVEELGGKLGEVYSINANDYGGWFNGSQNFWGGSYNSSVMQNAVQEGGGGSDGEGDTLSLGQISVSASVTVSFVIEGRRK